MTSFLKRHRLFWRFAIVGCSNTAVDFVVFTILRAVFDLDYILCQVTAFTAGILNSFILNKVWAFESKTSHFETSRQLGYFVFVNLVSLGVSIVGLKILSEQFHLNIYLAKVAVTAVTQVINYSGYRWWVFAPRQVEPNF